MHPDLGLDRDRCGRGLLRRGIQRGFGRGDVHARGLHGAQAGDRALQLAFGGARLGDLLLEVGHAEVGAVEQLEAGAAARFDDAFTGERDALLVHRFVRN